MHWKAFLLARCSQPHPDHRFTLSIHYVIGTFTTKQVHHQRSWLLSQSAWHLYQESWFRLNSWEKPLRILPSSCLYITTQIYAEADITWGGCVPNIDTPSHIIQPHWSSAWSSKIKKKISFAIPSVFIENEKKYRWGFPTAYLLDNPGICIKRQVKLMKYTEKEITAYFDKLDRSRFMDQHKEAAEFDRPSPHRTRADNIPALSLCWIWHCSLIREKGNKVLEIGTGSGFQGPRCSQDFQRAPTRWSDWRHTTGQRKAERLDVQYPFALRKRQSGLKNMPRDRIMVTGSRWKITGPHCWTIGTGRKNGHSYR